MDRRKSRMPPRFGIGGGATSKWAMITSHAKSCNREYTPPQSDFKVNSIKTNPCIVECFIVYRAYLSPPPSPPYVTYTGLADAATKKIAFYHDRGK